MLGHHGLFQLLLDARAELDAVDMLGQSPLLKACFDGRAAAVEKLIGLKVASD